MGNDFLTPEQRSARMALIKSRGTTPEKAMARLLRKDGIRYRSHRKDLPGKPDFALIDYKVALFVDGEFWHGRSFPKWRNKLAPYWLKKIQGNIKRDRKCNKLLRERGWVVIRLWEHEITANPQRVVSKILKSIGKSHSAFPQ